MPDVVGKNINEARQTARRASGCTVVVKQTGQRQARSDEVHRPDADDGTGVEKGAEVKLDGQQGPAAGHRAAT